MNTGRKREKKLGRIIFTICLSFLLVFIYRAIWAYGEGPDRPDTYSELKKSVNMLREGDYTSLLTQLDPDLYPQTFRDFALYLRGFSAFELGEFQLAESLRNEVVSKYPRSIFADYLNVDSAYYHLRNNNFKAAKDRIREVKREPLFYLEGARFLYVSGRISLSEGEDRAGVDRLLDCVSRFPGTAPALFANRILIPLMLEKVTSKGYLNYGRASLKLGSALSGEGKFEEAVKVLTPWRKKMRGKIGGEIDLALANALRRTGRYTKAIDLLMEEGRGESKSQRAEKLFFAGIYSWYRGRIGEAEKILKRILAEYGGTDAFSKAAYNLGRIYEERENYKEAYTYYGKARETDNMNERGEASFRRGLVKFLASEYGVAEKIFSNNLSTFKNEEYYYRNLFMKGYSLEKKGDMESARSVYEEILSRREGGLYYFHALRKLDRFQGWRMFGNLAFRGITSDGFLSRALGKLEDKNEEGAHTVERALVFQKLGLYTFSSEELRKMGRKFLPQTKSRAVNNAILSYASGDFKKGIKLTFSPDVDFDLREFDYLDSLMYIKYPALFFVVEEESDGNPDPFFLHSIFRQESLFDYGAISRAGAIGLGQIMPQTGKHLAKELNMDGFRMEVLFDPITNAEFSRTYIKGLIKFFNGELVLAAAAYNAGEGAVKRWVKKSGGDSYLFPELIGYEETRKYVRKVFLNYLHYLKVYGLGWSDLVTER